MMLISTKQICVGWDGGPEVLEMVLHVRDNTKELFANISARLPYGKSEKFEDTKEVIRSRKSMKDRQ